MSSEAVPNSRFAIAIDGPAASGKSTLAREIARRLGLVMVNSGAMYRAVTWKALQENIDPTDQVAVVAMMDRLDIRCGETGMTSTITIDGVDPDSELRSEAINSNVSAISAIPEVRRRLVDLQRNYLDHTSVIMEGRDIGSVVFPDTPFKIYIDASEEVRAARRTVVGEVDSVAKRDAADSQRQHAPLVVAEGAVVLDTSHLTIQGAVDAAIEILISQGLPDTDTPVSPA
ncbi:MAG: (d)CMP kinase [Verrucomicrobiaceae bacterium]|nr:MAG: (d)CMP kinase [Verrucomicrobiaceae bacterium]